MIIDFASYADDNTFYKAHENVNAVPETLGMSAEMLFKWFKNNQMKDLSFHLRLGTGYLNQIQI